MKTIRTDLAQDHSLRVAFSEAMVTLSLSANATFGDIARKLGKLSKRRYGTPTDICVTLGPASRTLPLEISRRLPVHLPAFKGRAPARAETMRNVVQLSGFVDSPLTRTRAGDIARGISGVQGVRNDLVVR